jgi:S-adenosylmethionine:tRNA ribosyltransferase-isomerase
LWPDHPPNPTIIHQLPLFYHYFPPRQPKKTPIIGEIYSLIPELFTIFKEHLRIRRKTQPRLSFPAHPCYAEPVMQTADFFYELPAELIAQTPARQRDASRLLVLDRRTGLTKQGQFTSLPEYLQAGDVLILNNSRVIPARLRGTNQSTGGAFELLLIEEMGTNDWWAMVRPGKRARLGTQIIILDPGNQPTGRCATVTAVNSEGHRRLSFSGTGDIHKDLEHIGEIPLPPYISRDHPGEPGEDRLRYQTVYAQPPGSVAAPTAGLHFTPDMLERLRLQGVVIAWVTLHVGLGTFAPVKAETLASHHMHEERIELGRETVRAIQTAKAAGRRVFAAGTTSVRVLESVAALFNGQLQAFQGRTRIFIYPPYRFQVVDALLTNFHLPCSTLLMLVSAFAAPGLTTGRERILAAYAEAIRERYRFFSYGDAMLLV